jgi:predicted nucleic acid-binding protein
VRYLLDTTFAIDYLRVRDDAIQRMRELIERGDEPFINDIVVCELASGARPADERGLDALIRAVEFVQPGPDVARLAGRWRGEARARGLTLSLPDALIAATADALGATVLTRNERDFALTPVAVEGY